MTARSKRMTDQMGDNTAAEALRESEHRLRIALSAADMGTWLWHIRQNRHVLDDSLRQLMGLRADEEVRTFDDFVAAIHPDDRAAVIQAFSGALVDNPHLEVDFRVFAPDGSVRWLKDKGTVFRDASGEPVLMAGACVDITRRKADEAALEESDRRKNEFIATLAHELRNPLAPLRNALGILRLAGNDRGAVERCQAVMERQVNHIVRLVDDLLEVARISRGTIELRRERFDLTTAVRSAIETSRPLIESAGQQLVVSLHNQPLPVDGDPMRLAQVFANLLNNATKYTDEGGTIWLTADRSADHIEVSVQDTGIGIPENMQGRVFDMFTQVDRRNRRGQGGLGIGLTLVRTLVQMHGGTVACHSEGAGRGTKFTVRLPLGPDAVVAEPESGGELQGTALPSQRILIVDDNRDAADTLAVELTLLGAEVRVAYDGPAALEALDAFPASVAFLDIAMPGMDGYQVARRIRERPELAGMTLVALTGWGQDEDRHQSRSAGFDHHLVKPVDIGTLQAIFASLKTAEPASPIA